MSFVARQFKTKTTEKRKLKSGSGLSKSILDRIKKIQTIQGAQGVKDLLNNFQNRKGLSEQYIREKLKSFSDDPVDQFMALDIAAEYFEELGDKEKADTITALKNEIREKNSTLIQAADNISIEASEYPEFGDVRDIREAYASNVDSHPDHVRDDTSLEKLHAFLTENYGTDDIEKAILMQLKLLSTDLSKMEPSASPERLKAIVDDLSKLKQLVAMHDSCLEAEEQLVRTYPDTDLNENVLIKQMLNIVQQPWVTEADFDKIPDAMNVKLLDAQIFTLTKVVGIVRMIPEEVFANDETKQAVIAAASEGLDARIEQEAELEMSINENEGFVDEVTIDLDIESLVSENSAPKDSGPSKP